MLSSQKITNYLSTEVDGVNLTEHLAGGVLAEICGAFDECSVLVFHDHAFDEDTQIAFSLNFGLLEKCVRRRPAMVSIFRIYPISTRRRTKSTPQIISGCCTTKATKCGIRTARSNRCRPRC